jgi:hypothetical protein
VKFFSYIRRHWLGELSLVQSYWIDGVAIGMPFNLFFNIFTSAFHAGQPALPCFALGLLAAPFVILFPVLVWQGVGIWRSAGHEIEKGKPEWAWAARGAVVLTLALIAYTCLTAGQILSGISTASFKEWNAKYKVSVDRGAAILDGDISNGSVDKLEALLLSPKTDRLVIKASTGGSISAAIRLAKIIREHGKDVVAIKECDSACTVLLVVGKHRAVNALTIVGFYVDSPAGAEDEGNLWKDAENVYVAAGMSEDVLREVRAHHSHDDMYEPTVAQLMQDGLITGIFNIRLGKFQSAGVWCSDHPVLCSHTGAQNVQIMKK